MVLVATFTCLFFLAASQCYCQSHSELDTGLIENHACFECDPLSHKFPACLYDDTKTCSTREACVIKYDDNLQVTIGCSTTCHSFFNHGTSAECPHGGHKHNGVCEVCCRDKDCTTKTTTALRSDLMSSGAVFCPNNCPSSHVEHCLQTGKICSSDEFCSLTVRHHRDYDGDCESKTSLSDCLGKKANAVCHFVGGINFAVESNCQLDCCLTNECVRQHFSHYSAISTTSATSPTTPKPTTTTTEMTTTSTMPPPSTTPSFFQKFETSCSDQLESGACDLLQATQHICQDRVAIELCPETCGVCQAIRNANCHDTVLNNGCATLAVDKHICDEVTAKYACPKTCGICDAIIENLVQDILDGKVVATTAGSAATTMAAATTMSQQQTTVNCIDLEQMPCGDVSVACNTATIQSECQQQCARCF